MEMLPLIFEEIVSFVLAKSNQRQKIIQTKAPFLLKFV